MKSLSMISVFAIFIFGIFSCQSAPKEVAKPKVKNIILLIGDGMGIPAVYSAMTVSPTSLNFERFPYTGFSKTYSLSDYITDSAAGGTALSSGKKTKNGVIGQDSTGNKFVSILEIAEKHGLATGLVSTSSITHATPASFIAHVPNRDAYEDIALEFLKTDIDVFIGGGIDNFYRREDKLNLLDSLKSRGYEVDTTLEGILASNSSKLAGLNVPKHNPYRLEGRGDMLPQSTKKAIEILSKNEKGFFLMVEGSQIDWAGHGNEAENLIDETLDFDKAIGLALDFAAADGNTLVIVTADHETGGVTIVDGNIQKHESVLNFSTTNHSAVMVPVFAFGPGSENFTGIFENTAIFDKMVKLYGF